MEWRKLNYLVPEPLCSTKEVVITEWTDSRSQRSDAEIDAVNIADVDATEAHNEEDNFTFRGVMITIA